ncbi:hypothetical protein [Microbacterium album]|uniref:Uncharacterized protein n=1 Tax=Microbacterium album TaxID=2053191 RepID=A0A917IEC7_9MICO|nr:hypothetical protein [Microbacterium album]GGH41263.1 hypothetical protein GCM10010921_13720 [Microbacterium album]
MTARRNGFHRLPGGAYVISASRRDVRTGDYDVDAPRREGEYKVMDSANDALVLRFVERPA